MRELKLVYLFFSLKRRESEQISFPSWIIGPLYALEILTFKFECIQFAPRNLRYAALWETDQHDSVLLKYANEPKAVGDATEIILE